MATRVWNGGTGDWTVSAQWSGGVPQYDDAAVIGAGAVLLPGILGPFNGNYEAWNLALGGASAAAPAAISAVSAVFGSRFTITSGPGAGFGALDTFGASAFAGTITLNAPGGEFTIDATQANGAEAGAFVLRNGGRISVSGGDTLRVNGPLFNDATIDIGSASTLRNDGTVKLISGLLHIEPGATLAGTGTVDIGLFSTLNIEPGAAGTAMAVTFSDVGGRLLLGNPAGYTGTVHDFHLGDLIDLPGISADFAGYIPAFGQIVVKQGGAAGAVVATINVQGLGSGTLQAVPDGFGGTLIDYAGTRARLDYTIAGPDRAMKSDVVRATMTAPGGAAIDGTGIRIGILADSFDSTGFGGPSDPANIDANNGYLPLDTFTFTSAVHVLKDSTSGEDEGRAMAQVVHQVAPGAELYFYSAQGSWTDFADGVTALQNAGCDIIVDDWSNFDEPFYQLAGPTDAAISAAIASGVDYFTSAGNFGAASLESAFTPAAVQLADAPAQTVSAQIFSNGTPYVPITIKSGNRSLMMVQWDAAYPSAGGSVPVALQLKLYDLNGNLLATSTQDSGTPVYTGVPASFLSITPSGGGSTQYKLAVVQPDGAPAVGQFKLVLFGSPGQSGPGGTIDDPLAGTGSGTVSGHALIPEVNTVGAVDWANTAAFGAPVGWTYFPSGGGPGSLLFDPDGNRYAVPVSAGKVEFLAPDGGNTSVPDIGQFFGTSAAAPNAAGVAALMLQANPNLSPDKVTAILQQSAYDIGLPASQQGSGFIQADIAVQLAMAACFAAGTRIATAHGPVAIERLQPGEAILTAVGGSLPAVWLGHRHVDCRHHPRPQDVWPIRVHAGAFGAGRPAHDLLLSPDHAIFTGGVLIPVRYLINGATIAQLPVDAVTYWHVELPRHEVILAEGLACESYLDTGNRSAFDNGGPAIDLHPDFARAIWARQGCAALVVDGPHLVAARTDLLARAAALGHLLTTEPALSIQASGRSLVPAIDGATWRIDLPPAGGAVRLVSRVWVPAHSRAAGDDVRALGVAIANLRFDGVPAPLADARLSSGWYGPEPGWRWTGGDAGLALAGIRTLAFDLAMTGSYWCAAALSLPSATPSPRYRTGTISPPSAPRGHSPARSWSR